MRIRRITMFKRALSFLGIFFGMAMMASVGDVTPQRLGSINRNTTMYSASQVDELIGTGPSGDPSGSVKTNSSGVIEANIGVNGDFTQSNGVVRLNTTDGTDGVYIGEESLSDIFSGYLPTHYGDASIEYGPVAAGVDGIVVSSLYSDFLGYGELYWMGGDAIRNSSIGPLGSIVDYYSSISARQEMENYVTNVISNMKVGEINNGTNVIDAAGNVYVINQEWKYFCNGVTYTESEWKTINEAQYGTSGKVFWSEDGHFEWGEGWFDFTGWYMEDGSGSVPVGITGNPPDYSIPAYASDTNALRLVYNWYGQSVVAFRKEHIGNLALSNDIHEVRYPIVNCPISSGEWSIYGVPEGVYAGQPYLSGYSYDDKCLWYITFYNSSTHSTVVDLSTLGDDYATRLEFTGSIVSPEEEHIVCTRPYSTGAMLQDRSINCVTVTNRMYLAFPTNQVGYSSDFYINIIVATSQPQVVYLVGSDWNNVSWVEPPPSTFSYGTNIIHVTEVDENVYSYTMPGAGSELRDVRIIGTLSQGHESASATNLYSTAQGTNTLASGIASHAEGGRTTSKGM